MEQLKALWGKVVENKAVVIPVATAVAGAMIGAGITVLIANTQANYLIEEALMSLESETPPDELNA